jgi:hypothetical protein
MVQSCSGAEEISDAKDSPTILATPCAGNTGPPMTPTNLLESFFSYGDDVKCRQAEIIQTLKRIDSESRIAGRDQ